MEDELKSGARLGRYELLTQLGRGGMASVWVAREWSPSRRQQRLVAVKAMLPELARQPDFRSMFLEEGQIVRSIDHPNVVKVYEVAEDRGILYMAMEWVEGDSLRAVIKEAKRRRAIPPEMAVRIIADTAAGTHAAHELRGWDGELRNLVHCDISPHNILVGLDGQAKLVDFGVANATVHSEWGGDQIKGKFGYMSPEQAQAQKIDRRSDIFALGIVLFELTTGERLFRGENAGHTLKLVTTGKIPDPRELHPKYPEKLANIVKKALDRDLRTRYQTADELRVALEQYLVEERILVSKASVGQLVRRVLGPRIEQQRVALREALVAADGVVQDGLLPSSPAALRDAGWNEHSTPGADPQSQGAFRPSISDPPTSSQASGTSAPFQQTLDPPAPRRRSVVGSLLFAVFGVTAAVAAIAWSKAHSHPTALIASSVEQKAGDSQLEPAARGEGEPGPSGVSIDDLPVAAQQAQGPGQPRPKPRDTEPKAGSEKAGSEKPATTPAPSKLEPAALPENPYAKTEPSAPSNAGNPPEVPEPPPAPAVPDEPSGPAGPFNRGAAIAALGSASRRASSCSRPDGPSGSGRATVTFAPSGSVSNVAVPAPFGGTGVGACISAVFKGARVPSFTGSSVQLPQSFHIPE